MSHFAEATSRSSARNVIVRPNRASREHVAAHGSTRRASEEQQRLPDGELDSEKLMQDLQEFLRRQREGAGEAGVRRPMDQRR